MYPLVLNEQLFLRIQVTAKKELVPYNYSTTRSLVRSKLWGERIKMHLNSPLFWTDYNAVT